MSILASTNHNSAAMFAVDYDGVGLNVVIFFRIKQATLETLQQADSANDPSLLLLQVRLQW